VSEPIIAVIAERVFDHAGFCTIGAALYIGFGWFGLSAITGV